MAVIEIKDVAKTFGSYQALENINLTVEDQEFMVLLGASGCGKSTLLRIIAGLETASSGEIWIGGRRIDHLSPKDRGIAMVFQNYAVFPHLTVFENIGFGLRMQKRPNEEVTKRVQRTAELMHIEQLLKRYSGELSGGQRQRVAVARALAMEPDVILMDEPLSNLDALLRMEMRAELKGVLAESKTTAIYVTHDQTEALTFADKVIVMSDGEVVQIGTPTELFEKPEHTFVGYFIGSPGMNIIPAKVNGNKAIIGEHEIILNDTYGKLDGKVELGIRPEFIKFSDDPNALPITINRIEDVGHYKIARTRFQNHDINIIINEGDDFSKDMHGIIFDTEKINIYENDWRVDP